MPLLRLSNVHLAYGPTVLLDEVNLTLHAGERIGLLGRNGAGKSSFLRLLSGDNRPDSGDIWLRPGITVACLEQELPEAPGKTVFEYVAGGLAGAGELLSRFHQLAQQADDPVKLRELETVQKGIDAIDGWSLQQKVDTAISMLELDGAVMLDTLSGGGARRAALARALAGEPDILLLDEPTNHLDIPSVLWLESYLRDFRGALITITHDRAFLQKVANRILELDRGRLTSWDCDYTKFLEYRDQQLAAEEKANAEFDKKLAQEETWIRQGIKARRTRNEGRVRALKKMREEFRERRQLQGKARLQLNTVEQSGKIVVEAEHLHHAFGDRLILDDFSITIQRGDKIGFIGPNGVGKTTLLKMLLGQLAPDSGNVKVGTRIELAYFDQLRGQLDPGKSVIDNIADSGDFITINGKQKHVISWLQDFLFTPDRIRQPVSALSGGEQNRLILARLFSKPANVLVLDEPTNDLDLETLELLEEKLLDYEGTLLLVSHDRAFLDNVVTSSIVFTGNGKVEHIVGGYSDWLALGGELGRQSKVPEAKPKSAAKPTATPAKPLRRKLSYKDQRELDMLPGLIEQKEAEITELEARTAATGFYQQDHQQIQKVLDALSSAQQALETAFERWAELDAME